MNRHVIVAGLAFGDEGKGAVVDWLCSPLATAGPVSAVVRFNGGAQAGHNVVTEDGRHHTFSQFGAGTLRGVPTFLSRFMLVEPLALAAEASHLASLGVGNPLGLISIDRRALLTTPFHAAANRARELARGAGAHGTCGRGIGETVSWARHAGADAPAVADCANPHLLRRKLSLLHDAYVAEFGAPLPTPSIEDLLETYTAFAKTVRLTEEPYLPGLLSTGRVVFEGAQGVLLDAQRGFHPHTTWSNTTFGNAQALLEEAGVDPDKATKFGVLRSYTTRHGQGPFPTEDAALAALLPESHNNGASVQGAWRVGHLDLVLARYATEVARPDAIVLTHLDRAQTLGLQMARAYDLGKGPVNQLKPGAPQDRHHQELLTKDLFRARPLLEVLSSSLEDAVAQACGVPVAVTSDGPGAEHFRVRDS